MPEEMKEKITPIKKEQPEKAESAQKTYMNSQKLEEEKAAFKQYQKDQDHLLKTEKDKLTKRQNKLNKEKSALENEKNLYLKKENSCWKIERTYYYSNRHLMRKKQARRTGTWV